MRKTFACLSLCLAAAAACNDPKKNDGTEPEPDLAQTQQPQPDLAQPAPLKRRVFVTKGKFTGNLGGTAGADAKCNSAANAVGLGGTWRAWLSTTTVNAKDTLTDTSPWYKLDRTTVMFPSKTALGAGPSDYVRQFEDGTEFDSDGDRLDVWTGTSPSGTFMAGTCLDWTSDVAEQSGTTGCDNAIAEWSTCGISQLSCDSNAHLYCFEQ